MTKKAATATAQSTKERILAAAKRHFAEHGLHQASIRAITKLAGVNSALLRYHFGSKSELYEAVIRDSAQRLIVNRRRVLDTLTAESGGDPIAVNSLVRAYAAPVLHDARNSSRDVAIYLRLFGRHFTEPSDRLSQITQSQFTESQDQFIAELQRSLPDQTHDEIAFKFGLMIGALALLGSSAGIIEELTGGRFDTKDEKRAIDAFVSAFTHLFCGKRTPASSPYGAGGS